MFLKNRPTIGSIQAEDYKRWWEKVNNSLTADQQALSASHKAFGVRENRP